MPKVGMEPIRRQQLIDATLTSIDELGLANTTINSISRYAGVSSGIISHYFGGKEALLRATMHHILKLAEALYQESVNCLPEYAHYERLVALININLAGQKTAAFTAKIWLAFWVQAQYDPRLQRLQRILEQRLLSNLVYEMKYLVGRTNARGCANMLTLLMDGVRLKRALSKQAIQAEESLSLCQTCLRWMIKEHQTDPYI